MAARSSGKSRKASRTNTASVSAYRAMRQDTSRADTASPSQTGSAATQASSDTTSGHRDSVVVGDSANVGKTGNRLEPTQSSGQANADTLSNGQGSDRIRPPEDSTETVGAAADTSGVQAQVDTQQTEMAQQAPADTGAIRAQADTATQVDTAGQRSEMAQQSATDSSGVQAQADTTSGQTEMAQRAPADTAVPAQPDTMNAQQPSDAASQPTDNAQSDSAPVGAASVQSAGNLATGAEAVALISRAGRRCAVVDTDQDHSARWDLAESPASMNPCGTGTMTLPKVQEEK
jgi:hypothetical protein